MAPNIFVKFSCPYTKFWAELTTWHSFCITFIGTAHPETLLRVASRMLSNSRQYAGYPGPIQYAKGGLIRPQRGTPTETPKDLGTDRYDLSSSQPAC